MIELDSRQLTLPPLFSCSYNSSSASTITALSRSLYGLGTPGRGAGNKTSPLPARTLVSDYQQTKKHRATRAAQFFRYPGFHDLQPIRGSDVL